MVEFFRTKTVKAAKAHRCEQCGKQIDIGTQHVYCAYKVDGGFTAYREHADCRDASIELNNARDLDPYDVWQFLYCDEFEPDERDWLRGKYPAVAERLWGSE